nr:SCP2 sterol-binding domain-containing protein [Micromonospora sp. DSM 115978]
MPSPTMEFFEMLRERGPEVLPAKFALGSIRFDLERGAELEHWFVAMDRGEMIISQEERPADCVVRTEGAIFDRIVLGQVNMNAGVFRNDITVEGVVPLLLLFRRAIPSAPDAHDPRELVRERARR